MGFTSQDVQFNADLTITTMDTMIGDGVDGIAIVVPDRALGPVVAAKAAEVGIPIIARGRRLHRRGTARPWPTSA